MMKSYLSPAAILFFSLFGSAIAQPIQSPFQFVQADNDTLASPILPLPPVYIKSHVKLDGKGHFVVSNDSIGFDRIRFFGTELEYTAQFLGSTDAHILAKRLHKLGFNAVRLIDNDYNNWNGGSFFDNSNKNTSYNINPLLLAKFDTLVYELKNQGIYSFLVLNSTHDFFPGDGVAQWDTVHYNSQFVHFIDNRASELHRMWAKTLLTHVNPLTGLRLGDDPALAAIEITSPGLSLMAGWRFNYLNWINTNNVVNRGGTQTVGWNRSRRLDTLFSQYLLHKYGSDAGINNAWAGPPVINSPNLVDDGSFEQAGSSAWSFNVYNGATGVSSLLSPGIDSQFCIWNILSTLSTKPDAGDAVLANASTRLGKDTLYQISFYAKIHFDPAKPVLTRPIIVYIQNYQNYTVSLSTSQMIDTAWKKYTFTFRAASAGLHRLVFAFGQQLGDPMFDGVSIKKQSEVGFVLGETSNNFSVIRIPYGATDLLPRQRVRDMALFYDSLQNDYFIAMKKCIADTIKSSVLVNFYCPEWWGSIQDVYANRFGDFAQAHINSDYSRQRDASTPNTDSTWVMSNNSLLTDLYNGDMGYLASEAIDGKPFIGRYMNLVTNQQCAAEIPFFTSYASLQDWDGLFFPNYATYYEDLFANYARKDIWWSIAGNPSLLVQMPQASDAFRNEKIKASTLKATTTILHDADDILLKSLPSSSSLSINNTGAFGVEGYLQPDIAALYQVRELFDTTVHRVAAEYPYQYDTITKVSETEEIQWSQSGGYLLTHATGFAAAAGVFGTDTVISGNLKFRRLDGVMDMQSILLSLLSPSTRLLTIASRSQNFLESWQYNDSGVKHWGVAPTIMSAGKFEFFVSSDSARIIAHPLDSSGAMTSQTIEGIKIPGTNTFKVTLDQSVSKTPWYFIEEKPASSSVLSTDAAISDVQVMPNPAESEIHIKLSLANSGIIRISLFDDLGREVTVVANGELNQGSFDLPLSVKELPAGHYILRTDCASKTISRSVNVIR